MKSITTALKNSNNERLEIEVREESGKYTVYLKANDMRLATGFNTIEESLNWAKQYLSTSIITINK